ncbi:PadR family transcriptional regulator [Psychrobacillus sp. NEAU-3TGS]|uniref:PadR family transcriptional regulator n=1 Tax=Psychrobacillus sp. NEAU-3TGS TaxID=2995412 RepID=UPI0024996FD6|nr:PadR family transcriptional regulator [Psychrobacillus sp. NEAU-3TGS]MDI2588593.1 PadR family transcriptional regulator [Psychrobacillus sp. NEAU-3TGS]
MNDPLKNLKSSMEKSIFKDFSFSNERKNAVRETIRTNQQAQFHIETIIAILESVQYESKDGYNISVQLFQKDERTFQKNEGQLYTLLHLLENKEILTSNWLNNKKYYSLNSKGKKYLATYKKDTDKQGLSLNPFITEASL